MMGSTGNQLNFSVCIHQSARLLDMCATLIQDNDMNTSKFVGCIALLIIMVFPFGLPAQDDNRLPDKLVVGTLDIPTYAMVSGGQQ